MKNEDQILKDFSKWLDDQLDFKKIIGGIAGAAVETVDGMVFNMTFKAAFEKVPTEYREDVLSVLENVMSGNYKDISKDAIQIAVLRINTPLGDDKESIILSGIADIVFKLIESEKVSFTAKNGEPGQGPIEPDPE
jgi:hypothetical protein